MADSHFPTISEVSASCAVSGKRPFRQLAVVDEADSEVLRRPLVLPSVLMALLWPLGGAVRGRVQHGGEGDVERAYQAQNGRHTLLPIRLQRVLSTLSSIDNN